MRIVHSMYYVQITLIGVDDTTHPVLDTEDVIVDRVDIVDGRGGITDESRGIQTTEIQRPGRLEFGGFETERVGEQIARHGAAAVRHVVEGGHG